MVRFFSCAPHRPLRRQPLPHLYFPYLSSHLSPFPPLRQPPPPLFLFLFLPLPTSPLPFLSPPSAAATMVKTPRPWKGARTTRASAMAVRFGADGRTSWATKMAQREERAALVAASAARAAAYGATAKAERERRQAKRERKEANRLRSAKTQVVRFFFCRSAHAGVWGVWEGEGTTRWG